MLHVVNNGDGISFRGDVANAGDLLAAALLAGKCPDYSIDDDDEDCCDSERSCFTCRYRRWLADGFSCTRGRLSDGPDHSAAP
ncbi:hypothetical protein [Geobacter sp. SVR]|uniref:hypothetical protein n=1 Tax=Geobacter sp. SVR TaxID=2495594 RepID=UPI00143EFAD4|nr:hypothetical protein [Geobacter sp. SVR]BCS55751.1 hypothetical protein GSVR_40590 [Geobacter sp. SVR]GCF83755.1 hypothetical protein GSbR_03550 [Geobacter sp. SVR]